MERARSIGESMDVKYPPQTSARRPLILALGLLLVAPVAAQAQQAAVADAAAAEQQAPANFDANEYLVRGNSVLSALDIESTVEPFLGPKRSLADVYAARDSLQKVYQSKGYQSVVVEVPPQQVAGGVILLQVVENRVGRMRVEGAKYHSPGAVREAVPALAEGSVPNFSQAQDQLAQLNRQPGRQVVPQLKPGTVPQTMDVTLKVDDSSPMHASLEVNNDHSADTPELRTVANVRYDNLWQLGHTISATYIVAPQDRNAAEVYALSYLAPLNSEWSLLGSGYSSNSNTNTVGGTTVLGKGHAFSLQATRVLPTLGNFGQSVSLGIAAKHSDQNISLSGQSSKTPISYVPLTLTYTGQRTTDKSSSVLTLAGNFGWRGLGSDGARFDNQRYNARENFAYLHVDYNYLRQVGRDFVVNVRASGQAADSPLVSSEQFAAGGANTVRGYLTAENTADNGAVASVELRTPSIAPWLGAFANEWRFHVFVDGSRLLLIDPLPEQRSRFTLLSTGVGTRFTIFQYFDGQLEYAYPLKDGVRTKAHQGQVLFSVKAGI
jgi:hemolysin activation/secretion protein